MSPIHAQLQDEAPIAEFNGLRTSVAIGYLKPHLGDGAGQVLNSEGKFGGAEALQIGIGYDVRRFGATLAIELASPSSFKGRASALSLASLIHWY